MRSEARKNQLRKYEKALALGLRKKAFCGPEEGRADLRNQSFCRRRKMMTVCRMLMAAADHEKASCGLEKWGRGDLRGDLRDQSCGLRSGMRTVCRKLIASADHKRVSCRH